MSCYSCSNAAFTCNKSNFSANLPGHCALTSLTPPIPAHHFNLYCGNYCPPIVCSKPSANHGISCNAFNGYNPPTCVVLPGHNPSCPTCPTSCPNDNCHC